MVLLCTVIRSFVLIDKDLQSYFEGLKPGTMNLINVILLAEIFVLTMCSYSTGSPLLSEYVKKEKEQNVDTASKAPSSELGVFWNRRTKRARQEDLKNFEWTFSVESPSIYVPPSSNVGSKSTEKHPEVSVKFFNGFESLGAPGEQTSRLKMEAIENEGRAEGWGRGKSVFAAPSKSCCGPFYPFRTCCLE